MGGGGGGVTIMMMVMVVVLAVSGLNASGPNVAQCHYEKQLAISACLPVLSEGARPSKDCCHRVRVSHAKCICPEVTPEFVKMIGGAERAIRLVKSCGRKVPRHFKCGSVTTP